MRQVATWMTCAAMVLASGSNLAAPKDGLEVRLAVEKQIVRGDVDVVVKVTVTNTARHPVNLLRWQLPSEDVEAPLFRITYDGQPVTYMGPVIKRAAPGPADHVRLDPGASLSYDVELTVAYDLSRNGRYDIQYASRAHGPNGAGLKSDTVYLWLEGRSAKGKPTPPPPPTPGQTTYSNCSATQQTTVAAAVGQAKTYSTESKDYLNTYSAPAGSTRYKTWFGTYDATRWNTVTDHFVKIKDAFDSAPLEIDCKCKQNYYAYVYPSRPYKIYLCRVFWTAPLAGTDSQAGTLIHEMSHFDVVAGTDDVVYGQTSAKNLAISDPDKAITNADSHEYFAENNPELP